MINLKDPLTKDGIRLMFVHSLETTTRPQIVGCERDEHGGRCPVGILNDVIDELGLTEQADTVFRDTIGKNWIHALLAYNDGMEKTFSEIAQILRSHWGLLTPDPNVATLVLTWLTPTETAEPSTSEENTL
jgi:hypothetical protein